MSLTNPRVWTTKEGITLEISKMATPLLLATIHMIERNRMNNLMSIMATENWTQEIVDFYCKFTEGYQELCDEAERRFLIRRGTQKEGLVKRGRKT
jgi:hypothetical protein